MTTYSYDIVHLTPFIQGTITTDCNDCALTAANIVDWNLAVDAGQHGYLPFTLDSGNSSLSVVGIGFTITPTGWYLDGVQHDAEIGQMMFTDVTNNNALQICVYTCSGGVNAQFVAQVGDNIALTLAIGPSVIAVPTAVPEPATWLLLLIGFALLGRAGRSWKPRPALAARDCSHL